MATSIPHYSDETSIRLGQELVRTKRSSLKQVQSGLSLQRKFSETGSALPLSAILVQTGVIDLEDLKEALSGIGQLNLLCPTCTIQLNIADYERSNEYVCGRCSGELVFASRVEPIRSSSSTQHAPPPQTTAPLESAALEVIEIDESELLTATAASEEQGERETAPPADARTRETGAPEGFDDPMIGRTLGGCRVVGRLGQGGMGTVYEAEQLNLGRIVALKILSEELSRDETFVKRFLLEARSAASLSHPNIIHIHDAGQDGGVFYFTMEKVIGENLAERLRRDKVVGVAEALRITEQVASALTAAHEGEIIHRDIKPENIMLNARGNVKLADLGLAKRTEENQVTALTQAGSILGTPYYMAPEQARDFALADHRSDLYSLGVSLYKMLTGTVPYDGTSPIEIMMKAVEGKKTPVERMNPSVPGGVVAIVDRMMHVDPRQRFQSAQEVIDAIQALRLS